MNKKNKLKVSIPPEVDFADLKLTRNPATGDISFVWDPIEKLCEHNNLDVTIFREQHEDNVAGLLVAWYAAHLKQGGERNPVADELIEEVRFEDERGGGVSHPPGRG